MIAQSQDYKLLSLTHGGCALIYGAIGQTELRAVLPPAYRDALEVPLDPDGGLPWAYDVYPEDYKPLIDNAKLILKELGATHASCIRTTLIKKSAGEGRRFWHSDANGKPDNPPTEVLALYYLRDTTDGSGCLLVRPGFVLGPDHNEHVTTPYPDEVKVRVVTGDVVLMDPHLQHASLPNETNEDRLLIRLWMVCSW